MIWTLSTIFTIWLIFMIRLIICYLFYIKTTHEGANWTKMKWSMVKSLYHVNPRRWEYGLRNWTDDARVLVYDCDYSHPRILVSFPAWCKLRLYWRLDKINSKKIENNRVMEKIITTAQKDIDWRMKEAKKYVDKAREEMEKVHANLGR